MMQLGTDMERTVCSFLTPTDFLHWTGTNQHLRAMRQRLPDLHHHVAVSTTKLLHSVFDLGQNVLMHGPGGCGKTHALNVLYNQAVALNRNIVMTGTTGVSSCGLPDGMTLHSFSGLGKATIPLQKLKQDAELNPSRYKAKFKQFTRIDLLVIDEVSMLGTRFFALLDFAARFARESHQPFGGIQLVLSGDFLQLPPVGDKFIFTMLEFQRLNLTPVIFATSYRQKNDGHFFHMLKRLRIGCPTRFDLDQLESRKIDQVPRFILDKVGHEIVPPFMFSRHVEVEALNRSRMEMLPGPARTFHAVDSFWVVNRIVDPDTKAVTFQKVPYQGPPVVVPDSTMKRIEIRQPTVLVWKPNAQYILTQNVRTRHRLVNGSVCMTLPPDPQHPHDPLKVRFRDGQIKEISLFYAVTTHRLSPVSNIYLKREQFSLRVGYAVTIHSALGMTMDQAVVDAGSSVFASAQTYVACSRVRKLSDLYLLDFHVKSLRVNKEAKQYVAAIEHHPVSDSSSSEDEDAPFYIPPPAKKSSVKKSAAKPPAKPRAKRTTKPLVKPLAKPPLKTTRKRKATTPDPPLEPLPSTE